MRRALWRIKNMVAVTGTSVTPSTLRTTSSTVPTTQHQPHDPGAMQGDIGLVKPGSSALLALVAPRHPSGRGGTLGSIDPQPAPGRPVFQADVLAAAMEQDALTRSRALKDALHQLQSDPDKRTPPDADTLLRTMRDTLREQQRETACLQRGQRSADAGNDSDSGTPAPGAGEQSTPLSLRDIEARLQRQLRSDDDGDESDASGNTEGTGTQRSSSDFLDDIFALMQRLDKEWLSRFSSILENYVGFFNALTDVMAKLSDAIKDVDDNGNLFVDLNPIVEDLNALIDKANTGGGLGGDFSTQAEAQAFLDELGLSDLKVKQKSDGTWELAIDTGVLAQIRELFVDKPWPMSPAAHAAMISAKDSLMERFNHINRVLPDKYQRQLQMWDTLVKTLSGTIDSMAEANKVIMQNVA